jgi:hypothetical protein
MPAPPLPPYLLTRFRGSPDTLRKMREHVWGPRGEKSFRVRQLTEAVTRGLWPKDYLSEILAIRNFCTTHIRYMNDPLHVELVKDPERIAEEIYAYGITTADCDEIASMIATMCLQVGREAEFIVAGFGSAGDYSHVFARAKEPKSGQWIVVDPVAGQDELGMLKKITTAEAWSLDETGPPIQLLGLETVPQWSYAA